MIYTGSNDQLEHDFEESVKSCFTVKLMGDAQWFLQMCIHRYSDRRYSLDQRPFTLNTTKKYDPDDKLPTREMPLPTDYVFMIQNRPTTDTQKAEVAKLHEKIHFQSAVCTLLYLAYNMRSNILFVICNLSKACACPGLEDYKALLWLLGYIKQRPNLAVCFYPDPMNNPIRTICEANNVPYTELCVFTDASWQDCPDIDRSTVGFLTFYNGALIEASSTLLQPIAMSTSEAEYLSACNGAMAVAHIRMLLYDMLHLGTPKWSESEQHLPNSPVIIMTDNEATVKIACNGRLTRCTRHIECRFHYVREGQASGQHALHWLPGACQLSDILTKTQESSKIDLHLENIFLKLPKHMT